MGENDNNGEVKKMSITKCCTVLAVIILIGVIAIIGVRGHFKNKKNEENGVVSSGSSMSSSYESNSSSNEEILAELEESSSEVEKSSNESVSETVGNGTETDATESLETTVENPQTENTVGSTENSVSESGSVSESEISLRGTSYGLVAVSEPALGEEITVTALVSGKKVFKVDDKSYAYVLEILVPAEDGYSIISHFCSKKIYDGVSMGESLQVTLQKDNSGLISIVTISK